ncbi:MAG: GGDEF domain-containing protein [Proteobacteria bacterium]|nr:GGDEF domain-containing protein [Pseudomonadota bacterium]MBU1687180.1 GGDEF domain-containing protein [Pseudomonadota bacterium]
MKLRGRLIVSFTGIVTLTLAVFGHVTYQTFEEATMEDQQKIIRLELSQLSLQFRQELLNRVEQVDIQLEQVAAIRKRTKEEKKRGCEAFTAPRPFSSFELLDAKTLAPLLSCADPREPGLSVSSSEETRQPALQAAKQHAPIFFGDERLWVSWGIHPDGNRDHDLLVAMSFDFDYLQKVALELYPSTEGFLVFSKDGRFLFTTDQDETQVGRPVIDSVMALATGGAGDVRRIGNQYVASLACDLLQWDIHSVFPAAVLMRDIYALKNRIITAMLIVGWLSIWVVLVVAHGISKPLVNLTRVTKDMIALNYRKPVDVPERRDEIGELARGFETMRAKIAEMVTRDPLTGTFNRRYLMHMFEISAFKARRTKEDLACIMADIDFFKAVNDTHGHQCGDLVLEEFGRLLIEATRSYDTVARMSDDDLVAARYGGEEFCLLLPGNDAEGARQVAERIRREVENKTIDYKGIPIRFTVSLGVTVLNADSSDSPADMIKRADQALYQAKEGGRNRVVVSFNELTEIEPPVV